MIRSLNAEDFRQEYLKLRALYADYEEQVSDIRKTYASGGGLTEAHVREYFANPFLQALNWRLNITTNELKPNLIPESPIISERGTTCRLDYLGIEQETLTPLLIVETKHPSYSLPQRIDTQNKNAMQNPTVELSQSVIAAGLSNTSLTGHWNEWLNDLRNYVLGVREHSNHLPKRVVITNGYWLVLFHDPGDSFLPDGLHSPDKIKCFEFKQKEKKIISDDIADNYREIFDLLEHQHVLGGSPAITVAELGFYVTGEHLTSVMHGLRLKYIKHPGMFEPSPIIELAPLVFLQSKYGAWLAVESGKDQPITMPHCYDDLPNQLQEVEKEARELLSKINTKLSTNLTPKKLRQHYQSENAFDLLKGIRNRNSTANFNDYWIVTGEFEHFLKSTPTITNCPHHDWKNSKEAGFAQPQLVSIQRRSIEPKSYFVNQEEHHCTHREVHVQKANQLTPLNRVRIGKRSGKDGDPFCEIWGFEEHLCCRACVFEEVCTSSSVFNLPCGKLVTSLSDC